MSNISIRNENGLKALRVNGRLVAFDGRIRSIRKVSAGRWEGEASGEPFTLIGGRAAGGARNEWFFNWAIGYGDQWVPANSAVHALNLIENC